MLLFSLPRVSLKESYSSRIFYGFINQENTQSLVTMIRSRALLLDKATAQSTRRRGDWWTEREKEEGGARSEEEDEEETKEERKGRKEAGRRGEEKIESLVWQVTGRD